MIIFNYKKLLYSLVSEDIMKNESQEIIETLYKIYAKFAVQGLAVQDIQDKQVSDSIAFIK